MPLPARGAAAGRQKALCCSCNSESQQWWNRVTHLLELLPLASVEDEAIVKRLQAGRFADRDPPVITGMDPFGHIAMHLREYCVGRLIGIQAPPLVAPRTVPELLR